MRLVADRFVEEDDGRVVDLATGARVLLTIAAADDTPSQRRWAVRCAALQERHPRRTGPLVEMFHVFSGSRPHLVALWGPPGSGKTTIVSHLARIARVNGFVPVAARLVRSRYAALWQGRSVFVIADESDADPWPALLDT